jgi:hypothetical protein
VHVKGQWYLCHHASCCFMLTAHYRQLPDDDVELKRMKRDVQERTAEQVHLGLNQSNPLVSFAHLRLPPITHTHSLCSPDRSDSALLVLRTALSWRR